MAIENDIQSKATELGIGKCGIIKVEEMLDYADRLEERMNLLPDGGAVYEPFKAFADVNSRLPWAKSLIVVALDYGHYVVPQNAVGHFGKAYLFDMRFNESSPERKIVFAFEDHLKSLGLKVKMDEHPGITAYRWAAHKAGIGIIRNNNFLYTENGSWSRLCVWAVDKEMELINRHSLRECPSGCNKCIEACPTKSLFKPFAMNMATCVSSITASSRELPNDAGICKQLGPWIYGCDACQDVCPMNQNKWCELDQFPGLVELNDSMSPEAILKMSYQEIEQKFIDKFFYIKKENLWKWKLNALNVMLNDYKPQYAPLIECALDDQYPIVREKARQVMDLISPISEYRLV